MKRKKNNKRAYQEEEIEHSEHIKDIGQLKRVWFATDKLKLLENQFFDSLSISKKTFIRNSCL